MTIQAVRVKGLMCMVWAPARSENDPQYRRDRFVELVTDCITAAGIRICTDKATGNPCVWSTDLMFEVHELPDEYGNLSHETYSTLELLLYVDPADGVDLNHLMDTLPLGAEFPYSSWRPAQLLATVA